MERVPQIEPISHMKHRYNEVLQQLEAGPVVLTQHGRAAAVVVHPGQWNATLDERENLLDALAALRAELALALGKASWDEIDPDTFRTEVAGDAVQA